MSNMVPGLDRPIVQGEIDICTFVAGFKKVLDWSTADGICGANVEEHGVM